jgi:metal-responsive CopG/Arc/MetJ family transcriptional regulator
MYKKVLLISLGLLFMSSVLITDKSNPNNLNFASAANALENNKLDLSGTGKKATTQFALNQGLAIFTLNHTGGSNFIVGVLDASGNRVDTLVNEIGVFNGKKAIQVPTSGNYLLDIEANGAWSINIDQSPPVNPAPVPRDFSGNTQTVSDYFTIGSGLATFEMNHTGDSNFIVSLLDSSGNRIETLTNEIGAFNGSKATRIPSTGVYILDIAANGPWTIKATGVTPTADDIAKAKAGDDGKKEGCFVATAVYGDPNAPDINQLRKLRDEKLLTNSSGKKFVDFYYRDGPSAARFISNRPVAKVLVKNVLVRPAVEFSKLVN